MKVYYIIVMIIFIVGCIFIIYYFINNNSSKKFENSKRDYNYFQDSIRDVFDVDRLNRISIELNQYLHENSVHKSYKNKFDQLKSTLLERIDTLKKNW